MSINPLARQSWASIAKTAASQHGAFSLAQAKKIGLCARKLRAAANKGLLGRPLSDVYTFAHAPATFRQRCSVASLAGGTISHETAAVLHCLDGFSERPTCTVHVSFPRDHKRTMAGNQVHTWRRTRARDITWVDGIRCTSVARTLVQLGLNQPRHVVEAALDSALRMGVSPRWIGETYRELNRPGPTGRNVLGDILADPARSQVLTDSMFEAIVERAIMDPSLPQPQRQFCVQLESGERRLDLAFPDAQLGVEAHSRQIHFGPANEEKDNLRDIELAAAGWEVLYVTWGMAHQPELFLRMLKQTYHRRHALLNGQALLNSQAASG